MTSENNTKEPVLTKEQTASVTYTEEQIQQAYNEGQKSGYIAAIKNIRSNINDYLDSLIVNIVAASMNQSKGE